VRLTSCRSPAKPRTAGRYYTGARVPREPLCSAQMLAGFVRCNGGLDNGTALPSLAGRRGQVAIAPQPHHRRRAERVRRGALIVAQVRAEVTASALPRNCDRVIGRQRGDREFKAAPVAASARLAPPRSMRRSRCSFSAIPVIDACRLRCGGKTAAAPNRRDRRRARTQLQPRDDGLRRQNSHAHSRGPDCPTPCR
jgi:hypothetical protein